MKLKLYRINSQADIKVFNSIYNCSLEPFLYPCFARFGKVSWDSKGESPTAWAESLDAYYGQEYEICYFLDTYIKQIE